MEKPLLRWSWTMLIQISLCCAVFVALNIGEFERFILSQNKRSSSNNVEAGGGATTSDFYFLSVRGGKRPVAQQTHILKQMENVAKHCDIKFVINISELGEDDSFMQNGTLQFQSLKAPWYATNTLQEQGTRYFEKKVLLQHGKILDLIVVDTGLLQHGKILDLIVVDTGLLQDYSPNGNPSNNGSVHFRWLTRQLEVNSDWRIIVGYEPLLLCGDHEDNTAIKRVYKPLYSIFTKFGVDVYLSKQGCTKQYIRDTSIAHIGNLGPADQPSPSKGNSTVTREMQNGFFLHKVSHLEIVSYFINSESEIMSRFTLHQRGKEFM